MAKKNSTRPPNPPEPPDDIQTFGADGAVQSDIRNNDVDSTQTGYTVSQQKTPYSQNKKMTIVKGNGKRKVTSDEIAKRNAEKFLDECLTAFKSIADDPNEVEIRTRALAELKFKDGDQWPEEIRALRILKRRPIVTINKVKPAVRIICNDQRQNRAAIKVSPVGSGAHQKTAEILQGIVRHIEVNSMSDIAMDKACEPQVTYGFGYVRIKYDYASPWSMDQELYIVPVNDPFSIYFGASNEPDYSDADDAFVTEDLTPSQFKVRFPHSIMAGANDYTSIGNSNKGWGSSTKIRIAERFWRTHEPRTLCLMGDGTTMLKNEIPEALLDSLGIKEERETLIPIVHWVCFSAKEMLCPEEIWPGQYIPIIPVLGDDTIIDGKRKLSGVVRDAMDPGRQYNYFRSLMTETIGLAPKAPYVMAEGQNDGHTKQWNTLNSENYSVLFYKPVSVGGQLAPPPQRQQTEAPIQAMVEAAVNYEQDIKAVTMVSDAKLGARSNETSGAAINARKAQSDVSNYNYIDNRDRAVRHIGRTLLDLIPHVYSNRSIVRIIGEDDEVSMVPVINSSVGKAYDEKITDNDVQKIYNIGVGIYDVSIGVGQPYLTKREQSFEMLTKLVNSFPGMMQVAGDLIMENSDIPGAKAIAKRMYLALDPKLKPDEGQQPIPPAIKQAFEQMQQQMQQLTQQNEELKQMLSTKQLELSAEASMNTEDNQTKKDIAVIDAKSDEAKTMSSIITAQIKAGIEQNKLDMDAKFVGLESLLKGFMNHVTTLAQTKLSADLAPAPTGAT